MISFDEVFSGSNNVQLFPFTSPPLIAPFWCDANTRIHGRVFYRIVTDDDALLERARKEVMGYFIDFQSFVPTYLVIVTWHEVGYVSGTDLVSTVLIYSLHNLKYTYPFTLQYNTFQAVLIADERNSFVCFFYLDSGINWPSIDYAPNCQAGFNYGNQIRYLNLPNGMTHRMADIEDTSNIHSPGKWLFHVDLYRIDSPPCT